METPEVLLVWSTGSGFDLVGPSCQSSKHLCIFDFMVLCKCLKNYASLYVVEGLAWRDWPLTWWTDQLNCPSVLWHCWLSHLTCKIVHDMTCNVFDGTLNSTQSINLQVAWFTCTGVVVRVCVRHCTTGVLEPRQESHVQSALNTSLDGRSVPCGHHLWTIPCSGHLHTHYCHYCQCGNWLYWEQECWCCCCCWR